MRIIDCLQGSPEWYAARCGIPTSSEFDKIVTVKGEISKQRTAYLYRVAGERITKKPEETYQNENMLRGKELEEEARKYYKVLTGRTVKLVGLCLTEGKYIYGASPDGLVGKEGLLEIKCPKLSTHVSYLTEKLTVAPQYRLPLEYFQQTQGQLLVTGRKWLDFLSYYPGMRPFLIRVTPDKKFIPILKGALEDFCAELDKLVRKIK